MAKIKLNQHLFCNVVQASVLQCSPGWPLRLDFSLPHRPGFGFILLSGSQAGVTVWLCLSGPLCVCSPWDPTECAFARTVIVPTPPQSTRGHLIMHRESKFQMEFTHQFSLGLRHRKIPHLLM